MKKTIVIPVLNKLYYTKQCLSDLLLSTDKFTEIIVIDNSSNDGTHEFLASLEGISTISNQINRGCAASWNQGVNFSSRDTDWIIVLNNDVRLPKDWLKNLINAAIEHKADVISPGMREGELNYNINEYALNYTKKMKHVFRNWTPSGVCFAVNANVFDKIGLFDENFQVGQYEDADFFRRCKNSKIRMGITGSSFIHHYGSVTQKSIQSKDIGNYSLKNRNYHRHKWKINFLKRHFERYREQLLLKYWSKKEYFLYQHSLLEKHDGVKLTYS
jgi:N-acetylglucosaminyl-diphospho-decaprenol L-rhamnosyltransferase